MVDIKGLEKFAPKDFPGHISSTVFLGGCNFRCPFCHNADLVLSPEKLPSFPMDYFLDYLDSRKNWIEGICITGGEPLLQDDLDVFCAVIKERRLLVKLDTNGSFPSRLEKLIQEGLVDFIAMDVKAPLEKYPEVTCSKVAANDIQKSVDIIRNSSLDSIFRTTVVPGLLDSGDIEKIARMLKGAKVFQLQQFIPINTIDRNYLRVKPFSVEKLRELAKIAQPYFSEVRIEGK